VTSNTEHPAAGKQAKSIFWLWLAFAAAAIVSYVLPLAWAANVYSRFGKWPINLFDRDFINYWVGGKLIAAGQHSVLFDPGRYYAYLQSLFGADYQIHAWSYPPTYLLFVWPLGFLDYLPAMTLFLGGTFCLYLFSAHVFMRRYAPGANRGLTALAMVGFVAMMLAATQNGFLTAALMLLALSWMHKRPVLAAVALACLTVKPQLGILFALVVLIDRNWRVLGWTALFAGLLAGLSVAFFGLDSWRGFFQSIVPYQGYVMTNWYGIFLRMMPSTFGSLRTLGLTPSVAIAVHMVIAAVALPLIVWMLAKMRDSLERAFVLLAGTFVLTPYAFNYDMGALVIAAALLAQSPSLAASRGTALLIAFVAVLPGTMTELGRAGLPLTPLVLIGSLAALARTTMARPAAGNAPVVSSP
jgi:hypothetical protein